VYVDVFWEFLVMLRLFEAKCGYASLIYFLLLLGQMHPQSSRTGLRQGDGLQTDKGSAARCPLLRS
jgi:hypothetical protein